MNKKFYTKCIIDKKEYNTFSDVLTNYTINKSEEDLITICLVEEAKQARDNNYSGLYRELEDVMKGSIVKEEVGDMFIIDTGNSEAMSIMNSKASIFDINQLNVVLKQVTLGKENDDDEASMSNTNESFISAFNRILNESYLPKPQYKLCFSDAIKYSRGYPMAISLIGWDDNAVLGSDTSFMGDITCENIPLDSFFWDPSTNNIDNSEYVYITKTLPYRKVDEFISRLSKSNVQLLEAFYVYGNADLSNNGTSSLANNQVLINNGAVELITLYKKIVVNRKTQIKLYHIVGGQYIVAEQIYDIPYLPFSILKEHGVPNSFTGVSSVMLALPTLKKKFFLDGVINHITLMAKNPVYLINSSSGIDGGELIDYSKSVAGKALTTNTDPNGSVSLVPTPYVTQDMLSLRNQYDNDIAKAINATDINNFGSKLSGSAVQNVIDQSTIKENTSIIELEKYLVRFVRIMLSFIKVKLSTKKSPMEFRAKVNKDTNEITDNENEFITITPDEFKQLEADIIIDVSLLRTSKQQKQQQDMLQLYQMELQYKGRADLTTLKDIVTTLNLPNKEAVLNRISQEDQQFKIQQALQLVEGVTQLMKTPEAANIPAEQAVAMVLQTLEQGGK